MPLCQHRGTYEPTQSVSYILSPTKQAYGIHSYPANRVQSLQIATFSDQTKLRSHSLHKTCANFFSFQKNSPLAYLHRSLCVAATSRDTLASSRCECRCCSCTIRPSTGVMVGREGPSTVQYRSGNLPRRFDSFPDQTWGETVWCFVSRS